MLCEPGAWTSIGREGVGLITHSAGCDLQRNVYICLGVQSVDGEITQTRLLNFAVAGKLTFGAVAGKLTFGAVAGKLSFGANHGTPPGDIMVL